MKPYQQGGLDCLCGIYCIVNAVKIVCGTSDEAAIFNKIIYFLEEKKLLAKALTVGIGQPDIGKIFEEVINKEEKRVIRSMPFRKKAGLSLGEMWSEMMDFLSSSNRVILIGIGGKYEHWSLIESITENQIRLHDSSGLKIFRKNHIYNDSDNPSGKTHFISPTHTYFLKPYQ